MSKLSRRRFQVTLAGSLGLGMQPIRAAAASAPGFGKAKRCLVIFNWGGMSQLESWDPKPSAPAQIRGEYQAIDTETPGIQIGEYLPKLARWTHRLAIVRSVRHRARDHRQALYWSLTGVPPVVLDGQMVSNPVLATRADTPTLGAKVAWARGVAPKAPPTVTLPYQAAERGIVAGQNAGFLGVRYDPLVVRPPDGKPYPGVSPVSETPRLTLTADMSGRRVARRRDLLSRLGAPFDADHESAGVTTHAHFHELALDLLHGRRMRRAFALDDELQSVRDAYGDHILGRSLLMARRLLEAELPLVTVNTGAGDLNGGVGAIWDTHVANFPQLKNFLMPPFDHGVAALLADLEQRGLLDDTLVALLTEFGRQPVLNQFAGRDHSPDCYAVAFAGGGVRGGQSYGRSDKVAQSVADGACGPGDLHATIYHALGIDQFATLTDASGASVPLSDGRPLPLFG